MERNSTWQWPGSPLVSPSAKSGLRALAKPWSLLASDESVRAAGFAFVLSRALVFFVFILSTHVTFTKPAAEFGRSLTEMQIRLRRTSVPDNLRSLARRGDGGWYLALAERGYEQQAFDRERPHNWAFFPLYPLLVRGAAGLTGEYELTALALSNLFLLLALIVLHKTVLAWGYGLAFAERTVHYTAFFPASYFFSLPWTSSLLLLTMAASFLAARRGRWRLAGLAVGLASATHYSGVFLLPALLIFYWQTAPRPFKVRANALGLLLAPAGLLLFMVYLHALTGNAFAFAEAQAAWGVRWDYFWKPVLGFISGPFALSEGWNFRLLNFVVAVTTFGCGYALLQRREWAWAFLTFISALVPLSLFILQARYVAVVFPVFVMLAVAGASLRTDQAIRMIFIALLSLLTAFYGFFFGAALV